MRTNSLISFGMTFDATEMTPRAPTEIIGKVSESSPESTVRFGQRLRMALTRSTLPAASLMAVTFGCRARRATTSSGISFPLRPGTL